jgi:chaperone required for assembly of F1-ATPase
MAMEYAKGVKGEIDQRPKRFYTNVSVTPVTTGWTVLLDERALRSPAGLPFIVPTLELAETIAAEWRAQGERIDLATMFNTRQAYGVLDRPEEAAAVLANDVARYAETDLVCYLAERPAVLRDRQEAAWAPLREWAEGLGVSLTPCVGIMPRPQAAASLEAARAHAASLDRFRLAGLAHGVALFGSSVLGLAVERGRLTAADAYELSRIDEAYQATQWGEDAEAARRTEGARAEARALDKLFSALPRT